MKPMPLRPLSRLLTAGTWVVLACNALALALLPFALAWRYSASAAKPVFLMPPTAVVDVSRVDYAVSLLVYYPCGACTLAALWQARSVLRGMSTGAPFSSLNALRVRRVSFCCFAISGLTCARLAYQLANYPLSSIIWYYNTLFVPFFAAAGLFFLILAEIFRQAAELREENSLVI